MKSFIKTFFVIALSMILFSQASKAQPYELVKDKIGAYATTTLYTGTDASVGDTSAVWYVPDQINGGIIYVRMDTCTTGDSLKTMVLQDSPDNVHWYTNTSVVTATGAGLGANGASLRKELALLPGRYIRFVYSVYGSSVKLDFNVKYCPKQK